MIEMLEPRSYDSLKNELRGVVTDLLDRVRDHAADEVAKSSMCMSRKSPRSSKTRRRQRNRPSPSSIRLPQI